MNLSKLKAAIREMIISELSENVYAGKGAEDEIKKAPEFGTLSQASKDKAIQSLRKNDTVTLEEDDLNEMASFYKIKDDADKKEAIATLNKLQASTKKGGALDQIITKLKQDNQVDLNALAKETGKTLASYNNTETRPKLDSLSFLDSSGSKRGPKADPNKPAKEPKEPGVRGPKKGSKRSSDAMAFTMGGDVTVSGKTPTKAFLKRAVKAAQMGKPVELLKTRDLGAVDKEITDLSQELKSKVARSKEIAAKGNTKSYTPEEAAFMDDIKAKGARLSQLKATKEKILKTTVKRQDRNIDTANVDLD
jgi:hypothetical protein